MQDKTGRARWAKISCKSDNIHLGLWRDGEKVQLQCKYDYIVDESKRLVPVDLSEFARI